MKHDELVDLEKKYNLWDMKLYEYPLWINIRAYLRTDIMQVENRIKISFKNLFHGIFDFLYILKHKKGKRIYFIANRKDLINAYLKDPSLNKILVIDTRENIVLPFKCKIAYFFNILRYLFRKLGKHFMFFKLKEFLGYLEETELMNDSILKLLYDSIGDALFLRFLEFLFSNTEKIYYSNAVVPIGEKFLNRLNSYELQHGVITHTHPGYMNIPNIKNKLVCYDDKYNTLLKEHGYCGEIIVDKFKECKEENLEIKFKYVIFTQPNINFQKSIDNFFKNNPSDVFIKRHPRDLYEYKNIFRSQYIGKYNLNEIEFPICLTSTVIEEVISVGKKCIILKNLPNINYDDYLKVYSSDFEKDYLFINSFSDLKI